MKKWILVLCIATGLMFTGCQNTPRILDATPDFVKEEPAPVVVKKEVVLEDIYFEFDKSRLTEVATATLMRNVKVLKENPEKMVLIEGHCDKRGTNDYNLALGDRRAQATKKFLVEQGIDDARLSTETFNSFKLLDLEGHDKNRRAHFVVK